MSKTARNLGINLLTNPSLFANFEWCALSLLHVRQPLFSQQR
jgi:hypothetical protein